MTIERVLQELEEMNVEIYAHIYAHISIVRKDLHHMFLNEELLMLIETSSTEKTISRILYDTKEHATPYQIYLWPKNLETDMNLDIDDFYIQDVRCVFRRHDAVRQV